MRGIAKAIICTFALTAVAVLPASVRPALSAENVLIKAAVIRVDSQKPLPISRLDLPPDDLGFVGGQLATADNQTTGRFTGKTYETVEIAVAPDQAVAEAQRLVGEGIHYIVMAGDADSVLAVSDAVGDRALVMNALAADDRLRNDDCRPNLLHVVPSRAMMTDALAQFLVWKKWREWVLIHGSHPEDLLLAESYRRAARKFGAKIVEERIFEDTGGARRTDSGHVQVQKQIPVFTQRMDDHDVIVAADEADVFAAYLPYQTWNPRPVAGSAGLRPATFHPALEAWGATQFQRRFERTANRYTRPLDYQVWLALRVLGEVVSRTNSYDPAVMKAFLLSPDFELAAFKGVKVTFRPWNGQLRQPILLTGDKVLVSVSPQQEYLHKVSRLDTLGFDEPESSCKR